MATLTSTGTILSVFAGEPATLDEAGFAALVMVPVGEVTNIPEYGASAQVVPHEPLATGVTEKNKGFVNNGSLSIEAAFSEDDAGQLIVAAGVTGAGKFVEHSFKVALQDGSIDYFTGKIFSYTKNPGSANSMVSSSIQVEINSDIVSVAAP